jgi:hypothetical protein
VARTQGAPNRLLICEGPEDKAFFHWLIETRSLPPFIIMEARGKHDPSAGNTGFGRALRAFRTSRSGLFAQLRDIVIVADNDERPDWSFANVCKQVEEVFGAGSAPQSPRQRGSGKPPVSILMVPWDGAHGHLEALCVGAARSTNSTVAGHVDTFLSLLVADDWSESRRTKAWLRSNLAARCEKDPFIALGTILTNAEHRPLIPLAHASFDQIADYLKSFA